jgi:hypothetical protein
VSVTGAVSIAGSNIVLDTASGLNLLDKVFVLLNDGTDLVSGTFAQGATVTASNGWIFAINYADNGDSGTLGNDISLTFTAVPEPSTWIGGALAMVVIAYSSRKRLVRRVA